MAKKTEDLPAYDGLLARYDSSQRAVVSDYWALMKLTRKTLKRGFENIKRRRMAGWAAYPADVVVAAMLEHIRKHPEKQEGYTNGIVENMAAQRDSPAAQAAAIMGKYAQPPKRGRFANFEQREWDWGAIEEMERELLDKQLQGVEN